MIYKDANPSEHSSAYEYAMVAVSALMQ